jgi:hypothetical protein
VGWGFFQPRGAAIAVSVDAGRGAAARGAGFEFGQGLRRPEQERADVLTGLITGGLANRVSASFATYEGCTPADVGGAMCRLKFPLGGTFGPSPAFQLGCARMDRSLFGGQDDRLRSVDLVALTEFTLTSQRSRVQLRAIFGPRATVEPCTDRRDPVRGAHVLSVGALGGAHLSLGAVHLFAEATLTRLPKAPGQNWSHRVVALPTIGLLFQADVAVGRRGLPSARK